MYIQYGQVLPHNHSMGTFLKTIDHFDKNFLGSIKFGNFQFGSSKSGLHHIGIYLADYDKLSRMMDDLNSGLYNPLNFKDYFPEKKNFRSQMFNVWIT